MSNPFLSNDCRDIDTALLLERAYQHDIGNAVAYTDGNRVFINTDDNLFNILPDYTHGMLKWLLWHEQYHLELRHHNRYFKYLNHLNEEEQTNVLTKEEVNIIMDILVHDSLAKIFPELIETAVNNLAQMRNRNSLEYTFKTNTLEEMLQEYADYKAESETEENKITKTSTSDEPTKTSDEPTEPKAQAQAQTEDEHNKTDWSKLEDIDTREFIDEYEGNRYVRQINALKRKKFKLGKLTQTLNGLATTTKVRSYAVPSTIQVGRGVLLKGRKPGRTNLYLCFDASGSMGREMEIFKEIISKSIPQAMDVPTEWFAGYNSPIPDSERTNYYKGKFKDFMPVRAMGGYSDDGERTILLCYEAEQLGYSPIGVTDGGGYLPEELMWKLMQLKRTVLVGQNKGWLEKVQKLNPNIQIIDIDMEE